MNFKMGPKTGEAKAAPQETAAPAAATGSKPGWLKMGSEAQEAVAKEEAKQGVYGGLTDKRAGLAPEFWLKDEETARITFLSGTLSDDPDEQGKLNYVAVNLHNMRSPKFANRFDNYVCLADTDQACPFCEAGDTPRWHAVFPIVDHREIQTKKGKQQHVLRLYLAKSQALKKLHLRAKKLGGIAFQTFDVTRTGKKSPREGDEIEHVAEAPKAALAKKLPNIPLDFSVEWYEKALPFFTADEIKLIGFKPGPAVDSPSASHDFAFETPSGFPAATGSAGDVTVDDSEDLPF
jgi:hypothetical protein